MQSLNQPTQRAWLLSFSPDFQAAVGYHEMSQVIMSPTLFPIATAPDYCCELMIMQQQILPIMNIRKLLAPQQNYLDIQSHPIIGIALYQNKNNGKVQSIGMQLNESPKLINVSDEQACDLPDEADIGYAPRWADFSLSCFLHQDKKIPILNIAYLFSRQFRQKIQNEL